jgi:hypothetical protein
MRIQDAIHVSLLKCYPTDQIEQPPSPPEVIDGELECEVELFWPWLIGSVLDGGHLVNCEWVGHEDINNIWEGRGSTVNCEWVGHEDSNNIWKSEQNY